MRVIGTAGHVDHGKSTLIAALTGIHPDRLKEEREREMTIDLGFAWLTLPDGEEVGIVDVPGHRDFIENMLAGVGGIEAALLVIAADEGVMPQTREHLAILDILQIKSGIIVLTKMDLVHDQDWLDLVETDVHKTLQNTALEQAPIVRVSSQTKEGLAELIRQISLALEKTGPRPDLGRPRLPVDRVFSMTGFGTVVTGTLVDGCLEVGNEVELLPGDLRGRIRGLQTHKKNETKAVPGSRTAVNLTGVNVEQIQRGQVVTLPGTYHATQRLDVRFELLPSAGGPLRHHSEVKLFNGTAETIATVRLLGKEILQPGEAGWLQLELRLPVIAVRGDRYILRRPSPPETLGGGVVVDPDPKERHKRFEEAVLRKLESLERGKPPEVLLQMSLVLGPTSMENLIGQSHLEAQQAAAAMDELLSEGQLIRLDELPGKPETNPIVMSSQRWSQLKETTRAALADYHETYPLRHGMPKEELKSRLKLQPRLFNLVIRKMAAETMLAEAAKWVALPDHRVRFSPFQQAKVDRLMEQFDASAHSPPSVKQCREEVGEDIFNTLLEFGDLMAVSDEVVFRKSDYDAMVAKIRQLLEEKGKVTLAEVRDLLRTSRRYVQALLEHLDGAGMTAREGDYRRLVKP